MTRYSAFGLEIDSQLEVPWLLPGMSQTADVEIRLGSVPTSLPDPLGKGGYFEASHDTFLFKVPDLARYLVKEGREIVIDPVPDASEDLLRTYLLGSAFGALLHQRRLLVMHASSIQTDRGAVLFVGPSGHGKSTILAALLDCGYAMLADDVTVIDVESQSHPIAFASFPRMRLSADSVLQMGYSIESLTCVRHRTYGDKYLAPVAHFCAEALPVHAVFVLDVGATSSILVEPVDPLNRFASVVNNTYRYKFLEALGLRQVHFQATARLADAVEVRRVTRPASPFLLDELVERLEEELGEPVKVTREQEVG
jgi:hypothetical protein